MFRADRRHTFVVGTPVLLACHVELCKGLHDVARVACIEEGDEGEFCAIGVPKRPGAVVLEAFRFVRLAVCAQIVRHLAVGHLEGTVEGPI